jgi:hypothetical protein
MNPDNVGSLPACQALVKARIMMETEKVWYYDSPSDSWDAMYHATYRAANIAGECI